MRGLQSRVSDSAMIDKPEPRRFQPPWIAEETDACFIVRDASRQALAYVYFEEEPADALQPSCSPATRPGASPPTSPSCRSYWGRRNLPKIF